MEWTDWRRYVGKHLLTSFAVLLMVLAIASVLWYLSDSKSFLDVFQTRSTPDSPLNATGETPVNQRPQPASASTVAMSTYDSPAAHRMAIRLSIPDPLPTAAEEMSLPVSSMRCAISNVGPHQHPTWCGETLHQRASRETARLYVSSADTQAQWVSMAAAAEGVLDPETWDMSVQFVEYDVMNHGETYSVRVYVSDPDIPCGTKAIWHGMEEDGTTRKYWFIDLYHPHHDHLAPMPVLRDVYETCVHPLTVHYRGPHQPTQHLLTLDHQEQAFHLPHESICDWSQVCEQSARGGIQMVLHAISQVTLRRFHEPTYWHRKHIGLHDSCWLAIMMDLPLWPFRSATMLPDDTWDTWGQWKPGVATNVECTLHDTRVDKVVESWMPHEVDPYR